MLRLLKMLENERVLYNKCNKQMRVINKMQT